MPFIVVLEKKRFLCEKWNWSFNKGKQAELAYNSIPTSSSSSPR